MAKVNDLLVYRLNRLERLLTHPDVIVLGRLDGRGHGCRLMNYDWPQSRYVDFWPGSSSIRMSDGWSGKGWVRLLRKLEIKRGPWERPQHA